MFKTGIVKACLIPNGKFPVPPWRDSEEDLMVDNLEKETPGPHPMKFQSYPATTFERY